MIRILKNQSQGILVFSISNNNLQKMARILADYIKKF